jgi:hypothetical protein
LADVGAVTAGDVEDQPQERAGGRRCDDGVVLGQLDSKIFT